MLAELDYDHTSHNDPAADKMLAVRFYIAPVKNDDRTLKEGRLICDDTECVEIRVRGDRNNINQRPAREDDKRRFAQAYAAFKTGVDVLQTGTPLAQWTQATPALVEEFKYLGVFTVEQLADLSDGVCSKFAGMQDYKQRAKRFLEAAKGEAPLSKMQGELEELRNQREVDQRNMLEMAAELKILKAKLKEK